MKKYKFHSLIHQFIKELIIARNKKKSILNLIPQIFSYLKENKYKINRLDSGVPWLTKSAVRFLDEFVEEGIKVFEFGSGASTVYFNKKGVELHSVEHDYLWFEKVKKAIDNYNTNITLIEPKKNNIDQNFEIIKSTKDSRFVNHDYRAYSESILRFPDKYFDLILIDGRVRVECLRNSIRKLKGGGILIFDNSDRYDLSEIIFSNQFQLLLNDYELVEKDLFFSQTSIFLKN